MIPTWYAAGCAGARRYSANIILINAEDPPNSNYGMNEELHISCVYGVCVCVCLSIAERITMLFYLSSRDEGYREHHVPLVFPETREKAKQMRNRVCTGSRNPLY